MAKSKQKQSVTINKENKYLLWGMFASFLICVFFASSFKIGGDDDFFWHLATGRFIVENKYIPDTDVFGFITQGSEWIPFEWGWDVLTFSIYNLQGVTGILIFRSILILLIFLIYFLLLQKMKVNSVLSIILLFILLLGSMDRLTPRPHLISYLFVLIILYILFNYRYISREKYFKRLFFIPPIFLIWCNFHMGIVLGITIYSIFLITEIYSYYKPAPAKSNTNNTLSKEQFKKLIIISILAYLVLLINPHGIHTYMYAYAHSNMKMLEYINEWHSPFSDKIEYNFVVTIYKILLFSGLIILLYALRKKDYFYVLIYAAFVLYSIRAIRFTVDYEIVIIVFIAVSLQYFLSKFLETNVKAVNILNSNALKIVFILTFLYISYQIYTDNIYHTIKYYRQTGFGIDKDYLPVKVFDFIKSNNISGTPFNNFETGGYMIWNNKEQKNFIDSRNLNDDIFNEYSNIFTMKPGFDKKLEHYNIDFCVYFNPELFLNSNKLRNNINGFLFKNKNWKLVYWDDRSLLFVKNIPKFYELINKNQFLILNPYDMYFEKENFETNIKNNSSLTKDELERKSKTEPEGFFFRNMEALVSRYIPPN